MPARLPVEFLAGCLVGGSCERLTGLKIVCHKPIVHDAKRIASLNLLLRSSTAKEQATTGVEGDPTKATPELGKMFIGWKIDDGVNQIHELLSRTAALDQRR